jgi:hypothetical protein
MFEATLSIDLGASYTKVAYRPACVPDGVGMSQQESKVVMIDNNPLIPSLVVRTRNTGQQWIFGRQAAAMKPNKEMQVFQNWKADLFRPTNDKDSAAASIIAHRFFEWLRAKLQSLGIDIKKCQTRIAMPAFETFDQNAFLVARCLDLSGWDDPTLILKVREPHANILGLLSLGKNVVMQGAAGNPTPHYSKMFGAENPYIQAARGFILFGTHGNLLTVMAVDIGAFTTDLAQMTFDFTEPADGLRAIKQKSHPLGIINQMDRPFFAELEKQYGFSWAGHSFFEREDCKMNLYQGRTYPLQTFVNNAPVTVELGNEKDVAQIESFAENFVGAVSEKIQEMTSDVRPSHVFLTGGGNLIKPISTRLQKFLAAQGIRVVRIDDSTDATGTDNQRPWNQTGESLQRLATTIGGASVILQEAAAPVQPDRQGLRQHPPIVADQPAGYRTCRCQGGNKDCCFCGGRGFYPSQ